MVDFALKGSVIINFSLSWYTIVLSLLKVGSKTYECVYLIRQKVGSKTNGIMFNENYLLLYLSKGDYVS